MIQIAADHPRAAFASRDFRWFFTARLINALGTNIMLPALSWQIYALTRDPVSLGMIGLATFIPVVLSSLPSGQASDRLERRKVYMVSQLVLVASALSLVFLTLAGVTLPLYFYFGAALFGAAKTFSMPAATAWMPHLVPRQHYPNAVAWNASSFQIANVAGPALAGALLYLAGEAFTYGIAAACYVGSLGFAAMVRTRSRGSDTGQAGLAHMFSGFSYIVRNKVVLGATTLDLFALILGGATAMLPIIALEVLHVGETGFGLLRAAPAAGAVITGLLLAHYPIRHRVGNWLFGSVILYGVLIILFGASNSFVLSMVTLVFLGAADMVGGFVRQTLLQLSIHDDMRGRVTSVNMMFVSARNEVGAVQAGLLAALIGAVPAVILRGGCTLAVAVIWARLFPSLRAVDRFEDAIPGLHSPVTLGPAVGKALHSETC